jgi:hypothetical protein
MSDAEPLRFEELVLPTPSGDRRILVVTPTEKIRFGRERLARLREGDRSRDLDDVVLERIRAHDGPLDAVLLRAWDGAEASWGFDEDLDHDELMALGYHQVRAQLKLCRRALVLGTVAVVNTDLNPRDFDALLEGWRRFSRALRKKEELERDVKEDADLFLLDHFTLWTTRPMDEFRDQGLQAVFDLAQRFRGRLDSLKQRLTERERAVYASSDKAYA